MIVARVDIAHGVVARLSGHRGAVAMRRCGHGILDK